MLERPAASSQGWWNDQAEGLPDSKKAPRISAIDSLYSGQINTASARTHSHIAILAKP
jgi:hypothetical protein